MSSLWTPQKCNVETLNFFWCFVWWKARHSGNIYLFFFRWRCLGYFRCCLGVTRPPKQDHEQSNLLFFFSPVTSSIAGNSGWFYGIHPGRLTWNLPITHLERNMIFQTSMIMFHVNLQGCKFFPISTAVIDDLFQLEFLIPSFTTMKAKNPGCLGCNIGMTSYPVMWGW